MSRELDVDREAEMRAALVEHYENMRDLVLSWSDTPDSLRSANILFPQPEGMSDLEIALRALGRGEFFMEKRKPS